MAKIDDHWQESHKEARNLPDEYETCSKCIDNENEIRKIKEQMNMMNGVINKLIQNQTLWITRVLIPQKKRRTR